MLSRWRDVPSGGGGRSCVNTASRGAFRKSSGCLPISMMSACLVIAQNGSTFGAVVPEDRVVAAEPRPLRVRIAVLLVVLGGGEVERRGSNSRAATGEALAACSPSVKGVPRRQQASEAPALKADNLGRCGDEAHGVGEALRLEENPPPPPGVAARTVGAGAGGTHHASRTRWRPERGGTRSTPVGAGHRRTSRHRT